MKSQGHCKITYGQKGTLGILKGIGWKDVSTADNLSDECIPEDGSSSRIVVSTEFRW